MKKTYIVTAFALFVASGSSLLAMEHYFRGNASGEAIIESADEQMEDYERQKKLWEEEQLKLMNELDNNEDLTEDEKEAEKKKLFWVYSKKQLDYLQEHPALIVKENPYKMIILSQMVENMALFFDELPVKDNNE